MLARYAHDMNAVLAEVSRVLKFGGEAVLVVWELHHSRRLCPKFPCARIPWSGERNDTSFESRRPLWRTAGTYLRQGAEYPENNYVGAWEEVVLTFQKMGK